MTRFTVTRGFTRLEPGDESRRPFVSTAADAYAKTADRPTGVDRSSGRQNDQLLVNAWYAAVSKSRYPVNEGPSPNGKICVAQ